MLLGGVRALKGNALEASALIAARGNAVLILGGLPGGELGLPPPPPLSAGLEAVRGWALSALPAAGRLAVLLERLAGAGVVRRVVYLGVDGVLSRLLGGLVVEPYGSVLRLRCPCGRLVPLEEGCPRGCGPGSPDVVEPGEPPRRRLLAEAIYEATTADVVVACCTGGSPLAVTLALAASRFTPLVAVGGEPLLGWAAAARSSSLLGLLEAAAERMVAGGGADG